MSTTLREVADRRPRWRRRLERAVHDPFSVVMDAVADHSVGGSSVPESWRSGNVRSSEASANRTLGVMVDNDGWALAAWWYYDDANGRESHAFSLNRGEAHRLAWWILRWWAAEWFGLRRAIFYWALTRHLDAVAPHRRKPTPSLQESDEVTRS